MRRWSYGEKGKKNKCTLKDAVVGNRVMVSDYFSRKISMPAGMRELSGKIATIIETNGNMVRIAENDRDLWINIEFSDKLNF